MHQKQNKTLYKNIHKFLFIRAQNRKQPICPINRKMDKPIVEQSYNGIQLKKKKEKKEG